MTGIREARESPSGLSDGTWDLRQSTLTVACTELSSDGPTRFSGSTGVFSIRGAYTRCSKESVAQGGSAAWLKVRLFGTDRHSVLSEENYTLDGRVRARLQPQEV